MKILLDENIDVRFKNLFDANVHAVFTIKDMDWLGIKNGVLLKLLEENSFDVFISVDKNLPYQQNEKNLPVLIIILNVKRNVLERISKLYPEILKLISRKEGRKIMVLIEF
ncbi:MAG: hypothetical protein ABI184_02715 [Ginsengibacter sp.]